MKKFKKNQTTYLVVIVTGIIVLILALSLVFFFAQQQSSTKAPVQKTPMPVNTPAPQNVLLIIRNSGSTNFPGFIITIHHDGSGTIVYDRSHTDTRPQFQRPDKTFPAQTFQITSISQTLSQIGTIKNIPNHSCPKPASFGSVTTITYNGQTSGDISCIDPTDPQTYQNLKKDVDTFILRATR